MNTGQDPKTGLYYSQESGSAPVLMLEALAGTVGALKEGKDRRMKERVEKQSYYDTLRKNGYTGQQAMEIIDSDKSFADIGEPSDPAYLKTKELDLRSKQVDTKTKELGLQKSALDLKTATATQQADIEKKLAESDEAKFKARTARADSVVKAKERELEIAKKQIELEELRKGDSPELRKKKADAEKAEIELQKLRQERDKGFVADQTDQEKSAARSKSQAMQLIKQGKYLDSDGFLRTAESKSDMIGYIVDKFPGKVDFNDPDVQKAINEAFPDVRVKAKGSGRMFTVDSDKAADLLAAKDAKGKPLFEKA